jgi:hypothetical protein
MKNSQLRDSTAESSQNNSGLKFWLRQKGELICQQSRFTDF